MDFFVGWREQRRTRAESKTSLSRRPACWRRPRKRRNWRARDATNKLNRRIRINQISVALVSPKSRLHSMGSVVGARVSHAFRSPSLLPFPSVPPLSSSSVFALRLLLPHGSLPAHSSSSPLLSSCCCRPRDTTERRLRSSSALPFPVRPALAEGGVSLRFLAVAAAARWACAASVWLDCSGVIGWVESVAGLRHRGCSPWSWGQPWKCCSVLFWGGCSRVWREFRRAWGSAKIGFSSFGKF